MADVLKHELARLKTWQARALVPVGALLLLACVQQAIVLLGYRAEWILRIVSWIVVLPTVVLWLITIWFVFRTGQTAFGTGSGIVYLLLAVVLFLWPELFVIRRANMGIDFPLFDVVLFLWPGLFVIPHMIQLDIKRLHGVGLDGDVLAGTGPIQPLQPTAAPIVVSTAIQSLQGRSG